MTSGLYRAPSAAFVCLSSELEGGSRGATLLGRPLNGAGFSFTEAGFTGAVRYEAGVPIGEFDPKDLFPDHPRPSTVVRHTDGVEGVSGEPYGGDEDTAAMRNGQPFDGLLVDRRSGGDWTELHLFSRGNLKETREVSQDGLLMARTFSNDERWHVDYRWHVDGSLEHFEVEADNGTIWLACSSSGKLRFSRFDLDGSMFERMRRSAAFTSGFPEHPYALDDVELDDSLHVWGELFLEERLESLRRNPGLRSVKRLSASLPEESAFPLLERLILAAALDDVSLRASDERCRRFEKWFRRRHGMSLPTRPR